MMHQPLRLSNGLLSPANSEWVHFVWNWLVLLTVIVLFVRGMRGWWGWARLTFAPISRVIAYFVTVSSSMK